jgi:DNA-binding transcriptional LysR family regulator
MRGTGAKGGSLRRRLRLPQIELLAALDHAPTLSAAAREVNLSQPAASRMLRALSNDLGIDLFERAGRTLRPTSAGSALLRRAAGFIGELDRVQTEIDAISNGFRGSANVGTGVGAGYVLLPRALKLLRKSGPGIVVTVREASIEELLAMLRENRIDLIVSRLGTTVLRHDVAVEDLYNPPLRVVCGPHHPLARARKADWASVLRQEWILPEDGTPLRAGLEAIFRKCGGRPDRYLLESSSIPANVSLLSECNALWVLSADIAAFFFNLGILRYVRLPRIEGPSPLVMAYLRDRSPGPAAQRLMECLRAAARDIAKAPFMAS